MRRQELHPRTAVINKAQKNKSKLARNQALDWLAASFPQAFDISLCIRPLKVGIIDDILAHADKAEPFGISKSKLREALVIFTRRIDYLTCLKVREMRIDLEGNPVDKVSPEEAENAMLKIKKRVEKSARNARKSLINRTAGPGPQSLVAKETNSLSLAGSPSYPERLPAFSAQNSQPPAKAAATVLVKHKSSRQFDPQAVARLKEKLGLAAKTKDSEVMIEGED